MNETKSGIISSGFGHQFAENRTKVSATELTCEPSPEPHPKLYYPDLVSMFGELSLEVVKVTLQGPWNKTHLWKLMNMLVKQELVLSGEAVATIFKGNTELVQVLIFLP